LENIDVARTDRPAKERVDFALATTDCPHRDVALIWREGGIRVKWNGIIGLLVIVAIWLLITWLGVENR